MRYHFDKYDQCWVYLLVHNHCDECKSAAYHPLKEIEYWVLAGYSLGGLFALYSGYKTDLFKRIVSASGSMWYPNFEKYVKENEISKNIDKIYFSLGNKEKNSKIEILQTVEDKTREIQEFLSKNIETLYEENKGNHFKDGVLRMAKGIKWILE